MKIKLLKINNIFAVGLALALAFVFTSIKCHQVKSPLLDHNRNEFSEENTIQSLNNMKISHEFQLH